MEVKISGPGVASVANIGNHFPLLYKLTGHQAVGVALQVGVVKHQLMVATELIDSCPTAFALEEFYDLAIGRGHDRSARRGRNIDSVMHAPF